MAFVHTFTFYRSRPCLLPAGWLCGRGHSLQSKPYGIKTEKNPRLFIKRYQSAQNSTKQTNRTWVIITADEPNDCILPCPLASISAKIFPSPCIPMQEKRAKTVQDLRVVYFYQSEERKNSWEWRWWAFPLRIVWRYLQFCVTLSNLKENFHFLFSWKT